MSRWSSLLLLVAAPLAAQQISVDFPADAPISVASADWGGSRVSPRGTALVIDLRASLMLKNGSNSRVRGVTLLVTAADLTAGGKASVTVPSLDIKPGETFPVRLDLRLLRPGAGLNAPVAVSLDGVLFDTLGFYGPNKLNSRRAMLAWELEARRDRKFFQEALARGGPEELRNEMVASLAAQDAAPRTSVQVARGRSTNESGRTVELARVDLPGSPVEILSGAARLSERELSLPKFELRNRSKLPVRHVELGWTSPVASGGTLPAAVAIAPGGRMMFEEAVTIKFPVAADSISAYVASVEFEDGNMWVPTRGKGRLPRISPEEQRLTDLYRRRGLDALVAELNKFE
jgi:hypothetical protein